MPTSIAKRKASWLIDFSSGTERVRVEIGDKPDQIFIQQGSDMVLVRPEDIAAIIEALEFAKEGSVE